MSTTSGLGPTGFVSRSFSEIQADFRSSLQALFGGTTVDLSSTSVFTQLTDISANELADLWALAAAMYAQSYPSGATGVQVDQLLAVNNLTRLPAKATVTDPSTAYDTGGNPLYGLILTGTAGTVVPAGTLLSNGAATPAQFTLDSAVTIAAAQNAQQALYFSNTPTSGSYTLTLTTPSGTPLTTPAFPYNAQANTTLLTFTDSDPNDTTEPWTLTVDGTSTELIPELAPASFVQGQINAITGFSAVTVTGDRTNGFSISWPGQTPALSYSGDSAPTALLPQVQGIVRSLAASDGTLPFADVVVTAGALSLTFQFGGISLASGLANTAAQPIPLVDISSSTLARGSSVTALSAAHILFGQPAQGVGTATCTKFGATEVLANQLTTLVNTLSGVSGVTNPLDCVTGRAVESDADAITRLTTQQSAAATGSLAAIEARTLAVTGVTQVVTFQNSTSASSQVISFASAPTQGGFVVLLAGQSTGILAYNVAAADMQLALRALSGLSDVTVTADGGAAYEIAFGPVSGSVAHDLAQIPTNTTGIAVRVDTGCPAHAIEVVAEGGSATDIGTAILSALPAGIATYGRPALRTSGSLTISSPTVTVANATEIATGQLVTASELPNAVQVLSLSGDTVTLSQSALATDASADLAFGYGAALTDSAGNSVVVRFSRPKAVLVYANLVLKTDAGQPNSEFSVASVAGIQKTLIDTINAVPIGSPVIVSGTSGLLNSFRSVPGVIQASITLGRTASPTATDNLAMAPDESPLAESTSISIELTQ